MMVSVGLLFSSAYLTDIDWINQKDKKDYFYIILVRQIGIMAGFLPL